MADTELPFHAPRRLRALVRAREFGIVVLAAIVGAFGGLGVVVMGLAVDLLHAAFFGLSLSQRLSAVTSIEPWQAAVPAVGGLALGLIFVMQRRYRPGSPVDPIEANALHGGRMSVRDSLIVAGQTVLSSGVGASVGLEAGYTQIGSGIASWFGRVFHLRRSDLRQLVGCGAAAAIAGAFSSPLGGAFYAFELIIGTYSAVTLAPVGVAALTGYAVVQAFSPAPLGLPAVDASAIAGRDLAMAAALGLAAAIFGIVLMRGVATWERLMKALPIPLPARTVIGGALVGGLALLTPHVLSSGHGALHVASMLEMPLIALAGVLLLKSMASIVSLGSGFRGGLFFASLLLGALGGRVFAETANLIWPALRLNADIYTILGLGALTATVIGAPMAVAFIVLENTGDFWLTAAVFIAVIVANLLTREFFGYSFATWRFHLRGETIRSAADVGWIRDLTVARMMRSDVKTVAKDTSIPQFQKLYPLGSETHVVATDRDNVYAGIVTVAQAYGSLDARVQTIEPLLRDPDAALTLEMNIQEAARLFETSEAEELAVIDAQRRVAGILTEAYVLRRYADELERQRREILGED
jgi:CIC family chloride channel protein